MNGNTAFKDTRLLEVLDHIDENYLAEALEDMKFPRTAAPASGKGKILRSLKYVAAVAACALIMSTLIPMVQYVAGNLHMIIPGLLEDTSESTEESQTELENVTTEEVIEYPDFDKPFPYEEIKEAYFARYSNYESELTKLIIRNCGALGDAFAVFIYYDGPEYEYPAVIGVDGANGYTFYFPTDVTTQIYYEGEFYSINKAFSESIISEKDVEKLYNSHKRAYPNFYKSSEGESHE